MTQDEKAFFRAMRARITQFRKESGPGSPNLFSVR